MKTAGDASHIVGIGFDATCSLVLLDTTHNSLSVSKSGTSIRSLLHSPTANKYVGLQFLYFFFVINACAGDAVLNVIMWCDHRAQAQADRLNRSDSPSVAALVRNAGGRVSPGIDVPKLMWLNEVRLWQLE